MHCFCLKFKNKIFFYYVLSIHLYSTISEQKELGSAQIRIRAKKTRFNPDPDPSKKSSVLPTCRSGIYSKKNLGSAQIRIRAKKAWFRPDPDLVFTSLAQFFTLFISNSESLDTTRLSMVMSISTMSSLIWKKIFF